MKKFFAAMLALVLAISAVSFAFAEGEEMTVVSLPDIGIVFAVPADMEEFDGDPEADYCVANDDLILFLYVSDAEGETLEQRFEALKSMGINVEMNALADSGLEYSHIFADLGNGAAGVLFLGTDGCFYDFECEANNDAGLETFGFILGTLSEAEELAA